MFYQVINDRNLDVPYHRFFVATNKNVRFFFQKPLDKFSSMFFNIMLNVTFFFPVP